MGIGIHKYDRYISRFNESMWADPDEVKNSSSIVKIDVSQDECFGCGLPLISDGRFVYVDNSDSHSLVYGATGSMKTRRIVMFLINSFALAGEGFIVSDPKGEIYQKTSGLVSAKGYKIIVLNFRDLNNSSFWNPLKLPHELYHGGKRDEAMAMLSDFINTLAEPQRRGTKDPYFIEMSVSMMLAYFLCFIETATAAEANIYSFANFFASKSSLEGAEELARHMADGSIASVNIKGVLTNKDAKGTFGNVASGVSNMINPFVTRKTLCQVLSQSSFNPSDIGREKTAIYIIVPDEKTTLHFLVTAFIKQTYETLISEAQMQPNKKLPVRLNIVLDEFCNIPTIPDMPSITSAARSRNLRFFLMVQGMHQLRCKYGDDAETIKGNCDNWIFLASREYELLSEISNLCGETVTCDRVGQTTVRPLISVSELQHLSKEKGESLILHARHHPFVSELPDIDDYEFKAYLPLEPQTSQLPTIVTYDADQVFADIRAQKRPLPFSMEVYGQEVMFEKEKVVTKTANDIFDW
jgi:type IV secretion system protein VirD4